MPYCPNCKVSLANGATSCPLCNEKSVESLSSAIHTAVSYSADIRDADEKEKFSPAEKRYMVFELISVSIGILLCVTIGIDILFFRNIVWSQYTSIVLVMLWLFSAIPLILWGHPWLIYAVLGPSLIIALFLWALFTGDVSWFFMPALPITLFVEIAVISSLVLIAIQKRRGLNAVGVILAFAGLLCVGINASLSLYSKGSVVLTWSVVVLLSVMPVSGFFFYLHYRVINRASLRKIFRL